MFHIDKRIEQLTEEVSSDLRCIRGGVVQNTGWTPILENMAFRLLEYGACLIENPSCEFPLSADEQVSLRKNYFPISHHGFSPFISDLVKINERATNTNLEPNLWLSDKDTIVLPLTTGALYGSTYLRTLGRDSDVVLAAITRRAEKASPMAFLTTPVQHRPVKRLVFLDDVIHTQTTMQITKKELEKNYPGVPIVCADLRKLFF